MAIVIPRYLKYFSVVTLVLSILSNYEIPLESPTSERKTFMLTKSSKLPYNRSHVYKILTNIDKYPIWYPNVVRVEPVQVGSAQTEKHKSGQYRLITKLPIIGDVSSALIIHKKERPKQFVYSVNSWLQEINSIELKDDGKNANSTSVEWTVYTKRRSILFQYLLFPFAIFYKNQIVREALFTLMLQIRNL